MKQAFTSKVTILNKYGRAIYKDIIDLNFKLNRRLIRPHKAWIAFS